MDQKKIVIPDVIGGVNPMQGFYRLFYGKADDHVSLLAMTYDAKGNIDSGKIVDMKDTVTSSSNSLGSPGAFEPKYEWPTANIVLQANTIDFDPKGMIHGLRPDDKEVQPFPLNNVIRISGGKNPNEVVFGVVSIENITTE